MRSLKFAIALIVGSFATSTLAQQTLDWPVGELRDYHLDSGVQNNPAIGAQTVFSDVVSIEDAAWLRIYFAQVQLEADSFIRITSLLDQEVQELDTNGLAMWENSSAYFNGNALLVEIVAAPGTAKNRFVIDQVATEATVALPAGTCGICGADNRLRSTEDWSARLLPAGCSSSVWNTESCIVSAGHCMGGNMVIQFRVPNSQNNCNLNHPPVADQFPITSFLFTNGGVGNDWAVMTSGTNNLGQKAFDRYGEFRPIASAPPLVNQALSIWGYGIDSPCSLSQTQQTSNGVVSSVSATLIRHNVDATFGNSGSGIIRNGEILAIVTHCPCPNWATRVDHPSFAAAREQLCSLPCPWDLDDSGDVGVSDFLELLGAWGPCVPPNGPLWDNDLVPDGVNGRAISPPVFPDIRVVDQFVIPAGENWVIEDFHTNIIEDDGWTDGGVAEIYIYDDNANSPGNLIVNLPNLPFTKMDTGLIFFGRVDYDYWIEDLNIPLGPGRYWIGSRYSNAGGGGTNYWMTSTGQPDGPDTSGWFSLDAGATWLIEGNPDWDHAFTITGSIVGSPTGGCPADFDDSGDVGVSDFLELLGNWGPCP